MCLSRSTSDAIDVRSKCPKIAVTRLLGGRLSTMDRATGRPNEETTPMRTLAEFTKTTLIGGVLIILPLYLAALLLAKTVRGCWHCCLRWPIRSQLLLSSVKYW